MNESIAGVVFQRLLLLLCLLGLAAWPAHATAKEPKPEIEYGPAPDWIKPVTFKDSADRKAEDAPEITNLDLQIFSTKDSEYIFRRIESSILRREALSIGNINIPWLPSAGKLTIHYLRIVRGDEVIDVLADQNFTLINAEQNIEASILSGLMVANLQIPGLRVGDRIDLAYTTAERFTALPQARQFSSSLPQTEFTGTISFSARWDEPDSIEWKASDDIRKLVKSDRNSLRLTVTDLEPVEMAEGAPARYGIARFLQASGIRQWSQLSSAMGKLFDQASILEHGSPLIAQADAIAAQYSDPKDRAKAALALVQDDVRYVYVGLNGGNLIPASADESWRRRYGDCKGKTAMLLALLDRLGIEAEAVLVNTSGGGEITEYLPTVSVFDHVLVRAHIDGADYWMDGTITGDPRLLTEPMIPYRNVLPLSAEGQSLESRPVTVADLPSHLDLTHIDLSAGSDQPARVRVDYFERGVLAMALRSVLQSTSRSNADTLVKNYFDSSEPWVKQDSISWEWLADDGVLHMSVEGSWDADWEERKEGDDTRSIAFGNMGSSYGPRKRERPSGQAMELPWANPAGQYRCVAVTTVMPDANEGFGWGHDVKPVMTEIGGISYWRIADLSDNLAKVVFSNRTIRGEVSAKEMRLANIRAEAFDDEDSYIFETADPDPEGYLRSNRPAVNSVPVADPANWREIQSFCQ